MKLGLVEMLDRFDSPSVTSYREAVALSVFYEASPHSIHGGKSKDQAARWRGVAHRVLRAAIENLKRKAA